MASPSIALEVRARQCRGKVKLLTMERAQEEAKFMHKKMKARFNAYVCQWCGYFHVGTIRSKSAAIRRNAQ